MAKPHDTCNEINRITAKLIEAGICDSQKFSHLKRVSDTCSEVTFETSGNFSLVLKNIPYQEMYEEIKKSQDYNIAMADGALIQLQYLFEGDEVIRHRLAFLPSPDLTVYQNDPEVYESDIIFAEVVSRNIVTTPIRFDFDRRAFVADVHPMAHCTIGQYQNCRVPVSSAISPYRFFEFILCSFYNTAYRDFGTVLGAPATLHPLTITNGEQQKIHMNLHVQA